MMGQDIRLTSIEDNPRCHKPWGALEVSEASPC